MSKTTGLEKIIGQSENLNTVGQHPIVTIRVDSPKESPISSPREEQLPNLQQSEQQQLPSNLFNEPIDVNSPCDTTNVFYEYPLESVVPNTINGNKQNNEEIIIIEAEDNMEQLPGSSWLPQELQPVLTASSASLILSTSTLPILIDSENITTNQGSQLSKDDEQNNSIRWQSFFK